MNKTLTLLIALLLLSTGTFATSIPARTAFPPSNEEVSDINNEGIGSKKEKTKKKRGDNQNNSSNISFPKKFSSKKLKYKHRKSSSIGSRF